MLAFVLKVLTMVKDQEKTAIIGEVREEPERIVIMHTGFGSTRMIDMLIGDPLPRIC
jgi:hydrogenase expression/formation protein HypE